MEVANATDTFQWQVSAPSSVTQTLTYTWVNNGTVTVTLNETSGTLNFRLEKP
jgi:hypothetical protein